ncbi:MAG: hypothetical protein CMJ78_03135 [Planctomycetaceae bacterium]|nr:hypothetical protein [Planctomycetaceae bacterium]
MMTFLKMVGAVVALIIVVLLVYLYIKHKIKSFLGDLKDSLGAIGAGGVPPFRIRLRERKADEDGWFDDDHRRELGVLR